MIRTLIIDDSAFMRKALQIMLESDPEIKVVGMARDGEEGFRKVQELQPDIVTLDLEMPRMNGLECLKMIMREQPTAVLVVSSLTTKGAAIALEAMNLGAQDYIPKSQSYVALDITKIKSDLLEKVKNIARHSRWKRSVIRKPDVESGRKDLVAKESQRYSLGDQHITAIAIGVSTGGPPVIQKICAALPADFPVPVFIAQHMPREFTRTFAERLDSLSSVRVKEAEDEEIVQRGTVYIGRGGSHLKIVRKGVRVLTKLSSEPSDLLYYPSADVLFNSVLEVYGRGVLGVILTGMGKDGLLGLQALHARGGKILAQNEKTCVVYGMPKVVVDAGIADAVLSVEGIIQSLQTIGSKQGEKHVKKDTVY